MRFPQIRLHISISNTVSKTAKIAVLFSSRHHLCDLHHIDVCLIHFIIVYDADRCHCVTAVGNYMKNMNI